MFWYVSVFHTSDRKYVISKNNISFKTAPSISFPSLLMSNSSNLHWFYFGSLKKHHFKHLKIIFFHVSLPVLKVFVKFAGSDFQEKIEI